MAFAGMKIVGLGLGVAAALYAAFDQGLLRFNYPSSAEFPLRGVDVSHHQGAIDWGAVEADGIRFAYIKATEGGDFTDPAFAANWAAVGATRLARGAYHFYTFCRPPEDQLKHIVATVPVSAGMLPVAIDLEFGGNCTRAPSVEQLGADLARLSAGVAEHYGSRPVFYMTGEFYERYGAARFPPGAVWIRDVFWRPARPAGWKIWQFANRARVAGIPVAVDLNVVRGELAGLSLGANSGMKYH